LLSHKCRKTSAALIAFLVLTMATGSAADWPAFRMNSARSGVTSEELPAGLYPQWTYVPAHPPSPAWPLSEGYTFADMPFDYAHHVVVADSLVFFGSSSDDCVRALDAASGKTRWVFQAEGPIRFAPAFWSGSLYVVSDDGILYCLEARTGKLKWKLRGGPTGEKIVGNGRLISRWPARSGVAAKDGVVYSVVGMWPAEGVYLFALDARTGKVLWRNDTSGSMNIRAGCWPFSTIANGVSPQGYLAVSGDYLVVPTGRNIPAVFDRKTGRLLYLRGHYFPFLSMNCKRGGGRVRTFGNWFFVYGRARHHKQGRIMSYFLADGEPKYEVPGNEVIIDGDSLYILGDSLAAHDGQELDRLCSALRTPKDLPNVNFQDKDGFAREKLYPLVQLTGADFNGTRRWRVDPGVKNAFSNCMIKAGKALFVGGEGRIARVDTVKRKVTWRASVKGTVLGLAAAGGNLFASSDSGAIVCYGPKRLARPVEVSDLVDENPGEPDRRDGEALAARVVRETGLARGFCLVYGSTGGAFEMALARLTDLRIVCPVPDAQLASSLRQRLHVARLYGKRIVVHECGPGRLPYPDYFANLVVMQCDADGMQGRSAAEALRVLRPSGGFCVVVEGPDLRAEVQTELSKSFAAAGLTTRTTGGKGERVILYGRGPLPGAADWTHQYGDPGRSGCSADRLVKLPLRMLWFGPPGPGMMIDRHKGPPQPLCVDGRMYVPGENSIRCVDAYNGTLLWQTDKAGGGRKGATWSGSNMVADRQYLWVLRDGRAFRLDARSGAVTARFAPPGKGSAPWRCIARLGKALIGSDGAGVFAVEPESGRTLWRHEAEEKIRLISIVAGGDKILFVCGASRGKSAQLKRRGAGPPDAGYKLIALRAADGETLWTKRSPHDAWGRLFLYRGVALIEHSTPSGGRIDAFAAEDGRALWSSHPKYMLEHRVHPDNRRPTFAGDRIITWGEVLELKTGRPVMTRHPITGEEVKAGFRVDAGCNTINATEDLFFTRSNVTAIFDLRKNIGVTHYGAIRPSCSTNTIPAGGRGVVLLHGNARVGALEAPCRQRWRARTPPRRSRAALVQLSGHQLSPRSLHGSPVPVCS